MRVSNVFLALVAISASAIAQRPINIEGDNLHPLAWKRFTGEDNKLRKLKLEPSDKVTDNQKDPAGNPNPVTVRNFGTNRTGRLHVIYEGTATENPRGSGCWTIDGKIVEVTNPASQGSNGPISVDTNGNQVTVLPRS